ncbi:MAG: DUF6134 family protein [Rhodospirillales bacterium]
MCINRRRMLAMTSAAAVLPLLGTWIPAPLHASVPADLRFLAMYQGSPVGEHRVAFRSDGENIVVTTHIDITVTVLFITVFHYVHDAVEIWQSGRLISVESTTDDNGTSLAVTGSASSDGFRIMSLDGPFLAASNLLTTNTLWDSRLLRESRVIDVQHGGEVGLVVKRLGIEQVMMPRGPVSTQRYQIITPNYAGSLFFDGDGQWVKGLMERQGEILEYALAS